MTITLTEEELQTLIEAAEEGQAQRRVDLVAMNKDSDVERRDIYHFQAKLDRTENVLQGVQKKMLFDEQTIGDFSAWDEMPGGF